MRNAFINELVDAARNDKDIALVVGDLGYKVVEPFADEFPDRFFNAGVAEQNMMGLAAGLASEGVHVFAYSIANFPTFRCAEQIRNDVAYHNLPVTVVAVGGGLAYGNLGYSHHAVQDYALMRTMPNVLIAAPGDPMETSACVRYIIDNPCPSYLRLGKAGEPNVHLAIPHVEPGKWLNVIEGYEKSVLLTTGAVLTLAHQWRNSQGPFNNFSLMSMPLWGLNYKKWQSKFIEKFDCVVTVEDHLLDAGFGSWLLEATLNNPDLLTKIRQKALDPVVCGMVGSQDTLNKKGGLVHEM